jgi:hypothetical protein
VLVSLFGAVAGLWLTGDGRGTGCVRRSSSWRVLAVRVVLQCLATAGAKGNQAKIPEPGSGTDDPLGCEPLVSGASRGSGCQVRRGNATDPEDADGGFRKSYLFSRSGRGPGNLSEGDRVLAFNARSVSNTGRRRENSRQALENSGEGHAEVTRRIVPISAAGLRGVQPLVDRTM